MRDRVGEKPLYYSEAAGEFLFASEIKGILAGSRAAPTLSEQAVAALEKDQRGKDRYQEHVLGVDVNQRRVDQPGEQAGPHVLERPDEQKQEKDQKKHGEDVSGENTRERHMVNAERDPERIPTGHAAAAGPQGARIVV